MKKLKSLTILLGLSIIFGGTLSVLAQTKSENVSEKEALNNENNSEIKNLEYDKEQNVYRLID